MRESRAMSAVRRLAALLLIGLVQLLLAASAGAETTRVTFLLVNDIYQMSDQMMADGQRRGGFARLAAIVKAERAKGGNVIFAHGGDTISPSLMSGVDRGAHIIALSNLVSLDVFVPGNHEFDFGKSIFFQRMREAKFPLYAANLRGPDGTPLPDFKDRAIVSFDGVRIGLAGATYDDTPRASSPEDLKFLPTVATMKEQAATLRREGADFVVAVVHADRKQGYDIMSARTVDLVLSGHNHDLLVNFDGRNALVESAYNGVYVTAVDVTIDVKAENGVRQATWWPQFRVIDSATVTPDPEVAAAVAVYEQQLNRELDIPLATTAVELDSRNSTMRTGEASIGNLMTDAMRASAHTTAAIMNGGGVRAGKVYAPGTTITRRDVMTELPFSNRVVVIDVTGAALRRGIENGLDQWPNAVGRFPQVSGLTIEADMTRPPLNRVTAITLGGEPLDDAKTYRIATNDFLARGSDGYTEFRDAPHLLPDDDSPLLSNELIDYLKSIGTVRTGVEGRIVLK
jgi:2',3'-cyclic-nucleotide 2'-phosphodiesterase (5'-nucleotidase family)